MYRSPIWAIIELQSRWIPATYSGLLSTPSIGIQQIGLDMERRVRAQQPRPQFPHSDYIGTTDDTATPTQYQTDKSVLDDEEATHGRSIAGTIFRALHENKWTFERTITGKPSDGIAHGQAQFNISQPQELLYKEQGKLILPSQTPLDITQKYIYAYDDDKDLITVYFVDNNNKRGSLFHTISIQSSQIGWIANGEHLCSQDNYYVSYLFIFTGINLSRFEITYTVKGPAKDYVSKTIFQPTKIE